MNSTPAAGSTSPAGCRRSSCSVSTKSRRGAASRHICLSCKPLGLSKRVDQVEDVEPDSLAVDLREDVADLVDLELLIELDVGDLVLLRECPSGARRMPCVLGVQGRLLALAARRRPPWPQSPRRASAFRSPAPSSVRPSHLRRRRPGGRCARHTALFTTGDQLHPAPRPVVVERLRRMPPP